MAPNVPAVMDLVQLRVFYTTEWTMEVDNMFIQLLLDERRAGTFTPSGSNVRAIRSALMVLNASMGTEFDFAFGKDKAKKLHKRYKAFNWILSLRGVTYDPVSYYIECGEGVWDYIMQNERLGIAYRSRAEVQFEALKNIFQEDEDFVGWNQLEDITRISSDLKSVSIPEGAQFPRYDKKSSDIEWWNSVACQSGSSLLANSFGIDSTVVDNRSTSCVSVPSTSKKRLYKSTSASSI